MDIQKIISDIAAKITGNSDLIKKYYLQSRGSREGTARHRHLRR